jgi:hypothetical protein
MNELQELRELLDDTAQDMAQVLPESSDWARWLTYLLEGLDNLANDSQEFEEMLDDLKNTIETRLEAGRW